MADEGQGVPLAAMIRELRSELEEAAAAGEGSELVFGLGPIELELEVGVTGEKGGEVGIQFWVVTLGGSASKATSRTQRMTLTLTPRHRDRPKEDMYVGRSGRLAD